MSTRLFEKIEGDQRPPKLDPVCRHVDNEVGYKVKCGGVSCIFEIEAYRFCGHESDDGSLSSAQPGTDRSTLGTDRSSRSEPPHAYGNGEATTDDRCGVSGDTSSSVADNQSGSIGYSTPPLSTDATRLHISNGTSDSRSANRKNAATCDGIADNSRGTEV